MVVMCAVVLLAFIFRNPNMYMSTQLPNVVETREFSMMKDTNIHVELY